MKNQIEYEYHSSGEWVFHDGTSETAVEFRGLNKRSDVWGPASVVRNGDKYTVGFDAVPSGGYRPPRPDVPVVWFDTDAAAEAYAPFLIMLLDAPHANG